MERIETYSGKSVEAAARLHFDPTATLATDSLATYGRVAAVAATRTSSSPIRQASSWFVIPTVSDRRCTPTWPGSCTTTCAGRGDVDLALAQRKALGPLSGRGHLALEPQRGRAPPADRGGAGLKGSVVAARLPHGLRRLRSKSQ
jgi:hypothetical protein